ncbi:MAG: aminoglycoside phosphotransferase family protein [Cyclobacteriaceae bacterium]
MTDDLRQIISKFDTQGSIEVIKPFGGGHINDSFRAMNTRSQFPNYFLQRINHHVFRDVEGMMNNIQSVTAFLSKKYDEQSFGEDGMLALQIVKTLDGTLYTKLDDSYWRLYLLIEGLQSIDIPSSADIVFEGAKGFGQFIADLHHFDANSLTHTIPYFHHMPRRLKRFEEVVSDVSVDKDEEKQAIQFVRKVGNELCELQRLLDKGSLPLRVTHNDTKFNNILFDTKNKARCVVDLDTVMPGLVHYDFGDGVRTATCTSTEDEPDLNLVDLNMGFFEAYVAGFLEDTRPILTALEAQTMVEGALMMPFIMGVRFLTDYFEGNIYYKTAYPTHNLVRAKCQLELTRKMLARKADLISIVKKYS